MFLSRDAASVTIVVRAASLEASMSYYLIQQIEQNPKITVRTCSEVHCAVGTDHLETLTLADNRTGTTEDVTCARMFIFIGAAPRTDWLTGVVARVRVDMEVRASIVLVTVRMKRAAPPANEDPGGERDDDHADQRFGKRLDGRGEKRLHEDHG